MHERLIENAAAHIKELPGVLDAYWLGNHWGIGILHPTPGRPDAVGVEALAERIGFAVGAKGWLVVVARCVRGLDPTIRWQTSIRWARDQAEMIQFLCYNANNIRDGCPSRAYIVVPAAVKAREYPRPDGSPDSPVQLVVRPQAQSGPGRCT